MSGNINFDGWINDDGSENYKCRAWVNFNGTGTVAIRASGNVSSITDNGTGDYTVNFTTAMPDANYAISGSASGGTATLLCVVAADLATPRTISAARIVTTYANGSPSYDVGEISITIFR
jgi:hypothetical protein